jgi:hypothetical protein
LTTNITDLNNIQENTDYFLYNTYTDNNGTPCVLIDKKPRNTPTNVTEKYMTLIPKKEKTDANIEKWCFESIVICNKDAVNSVVFEAKIKNKGNGLYITENDGRPKQMTDIYDDSQVWQFTNWYGYKWIVTNKKTGNQLSIFNTIKITPKDLINYSSNAMIAITNGDLSKNIQDLGGVSTNKDYYLCSLYGVNNADDNRVVLTGTEGVYNPQDDSLLKGNPNEVINLNLSKYYFTNVIDYKKADGSAKQKWIFEQVKGTTDQYRIKNKAASFYLTAVNNMVILAAYSDKTEQIWYVSEKDGQKYSITCKANNKALRLDYGGKSSVGVVEYSMYQLICVASYADNIQASTENILSGKEYYIYNLAYNIDLFGTKKGGILTATNEEAFFKKTMENQDRANTPLETDEAVQTIISPIPSELGTPSDIWILKKVAIKPVANILKNGNIEIGWTIQNKGTGLYLTEVDNMPVQMKKNNKSNQIWTIESYPYSGWNMNKILRNYETRKQLVLFVDVNDPNSSTLPKLYADNDQWPSQIGKGKGLAGISCVSFARVSTDFNNFPIEPEDGKGFYIYLPASGGGLLSAIGATGVSYATELPSINKDNFYIGKKDYTADFKNGLGKDWDLLFGATIYEDSLIGVPDLVNSLYGIGFKNKLSERGENTINFDLMMSEISVGYTTINLRLNEYDDMPNNQTGLSIFIDYNGRIGLKYAGETYSVSLRKTFMNFANFRTVYIEDDEENNLIKLYFNNDKGEKTLVATFSINKGVITMTPKINNDDGSAQSNVTIDYGYNIYHSGYFSLLMYQAYDASIKNLNISIPKYSAEKLVVKTTTSSSGSNEKKANNNLGLVFFILLLSFILLIILSLLAFIVAKKKQQKLKVISLGKGDDNIS